MEVHIGAAATSRWRAPPFDLRAAGVDEHEVFVTDEEVIFVFGVPRGPKTLEAILSDRVPPHGVRRRSVTAPRASRTAVAAATTPASIAVRVPSDAGSVARASASYA